jgi:hypothetical protein
MINSTENFSHSLQILASLISELYDLGLKIIHYSALTILTNPDFQVELTRGKTSTTKAPPSAARISYDVQWTERSSHFHQPSRRLNINN